MLCPLLLWDLQGHTQNKQYNDITTFCAGCFRLWEGCAHTRVGRESRFPTSARLPRVRVKKPRAVATTHPLHCLSLHPIPMSPPDQQLHIAQGAEKYGLQTHERQTQPFNNHAAEGFSRTQEPVPSRQKPRILLSLYPSPTLVQCQTGSQD